MNRRVWIGSVILAAVWARPAVAADRVCGTKYPSTAGAAWDYIACEHSRPVEECEAHLCSEHSNEFEDANRERYCSNGSSTPSSATSAPAKLNQQADEIIDATGKRAAKQIQKGKYGRAGETIVQGTVAAGLLKRIAGGLGPNDASAQDSQPEPDPEEERREAERAYAAVLAQQEHEKLLAEQRAAEAETRRFAAERQGLLGDMKPFDAGEDFDGSSLHLAAVGGGESLQLKKFGTPDLEHADIATVPEARFDLYKDLEELRVHVFSRAKTRLSAASYAKLVNDEPMTRFPERGTMEERRYHELLQAYLGNLKTWVRQALDPSDRCRINFESAAGTCVDDGVISGYRSCIKNSVRTFNACAQ